jgi:hypothetical protein
MQVGRLARCGARLLSPSLNVHAAHEEPEHQRQLSDKAGDFDEEQ